MRKQAFQPGEIRDEQNNIIRPGAYGKNSAFATAANDGILDYIINNFDALYDTLTGGMLYVDSLPESGDASKLYVIKSNGECYRYDGAKFVLMDGAAVDFISNAKLAEDGTMTLTTAAGRSLSVTLDPVNAIADKAQKSADAAKASETAVNETAVTINAKAEEAEANADAASTSASAAKASAGEAASSQSAAAGSKSAAASSASSSASSALAAKTSETNAKASETKAAGSESAAASSASAAASSASAAAGSKSAAASSASSSASSALAAKTSETNAKASETKAAGSESAAASSASAAASSASAAASSQSAAKASEANAKTSETNAAASASAAAASASAAAASARTQQADWTETDSTFQSFIKNKPTNLLTTNTTQTITGDKEFIGAVTMATGKITTVNATTVNADTVNATSLTVTGSTSVPTANADNNSKTVANTAFVKTAIANLLNGAPSQLDTLQELSAALGNDANFSATVANEIGEKVSKSGDTITGPILYDKTPNDDTELPNKAYVDSAIKSAVEAAVTSVTKTLSDNMHSQYRVGSYIYSDKADNPATYLPYMSNTKWVQTAAGRVLIGAGTADSGTVYNAGNTGGEEKHKLSVEELPNVTGSVSSLISWGDGKNQSGCLSYTQSNEKFPSVATENCRATTLNLSFGKNRSHENRPPYKVVYIFCRTV